MTLPRGRAGTGLVRGAMFMLLWLVLLPSAKWYDLAVGFVAALCATLASLALLPPATGRVRLGALALAIPRFLWQSVVAGIDVAWRALSPSMPLRTGFVDYRTAFPRGMARNHFATITSLMPGTLPCGETAGSIEFHCLDTATPVVESLAAEERRFAPALLPGDAR